MRLVFATRPSALARWQTGWVRRALQEAWLELETREMIITTAGDQILDRPLPEIGGKGLFTQELESALLSGSVHAAVHSLKDLPVESVPGLHTAAVPARADARDALVSARGYRLDTLPEGALVGTSSLRRGAQVLTLRPDLRVVPLRGNVDTRLRKALEGQYDGIILAGAGLARLELTGHVSEWLSFDQMLPAPGQGALAVQCRREDANTTRLLAALDDQASRLAVTAERSFLDGLGGGCSVPVAAYAELSGPFIQLRGLVASTDGRQVIRVSGEHTDPEALGQELASQALAQGAQSILASIHPKSRA